jgi:hypothetical protein
MQQRREIPANKLVWPETTWPLPKAASAKPTYRPATAQKTDPRLPRTKQNRFNQSNKTRNEVRQIFGQVLTELLKLTLELN